LKKFQMKLRVIYISVSFYFKKCERSIWVNSAFLASYHITAKEIQYFHVYRDDSRAFGV